MRSTRAKVGAARWAFDKSEPAGWRTGTLPNVRFQFRPLVTSRGVVGVCGFAPANREAALSPTLEHALNLILEQTAIAIDRAMLVKDSVRSVALEENEKLRSTLLASLSHDLRTPLATITGAVTTLAQIRRGDERAAARRSARLDRGGGDRLTRFIANLLDMSRIEAGALRPKRDLVDVAEAVRAAIERAGKAFREQPIVASLARDLPFVRGDANLIEQVLFNLLDNAQKYGGGGRVIVHARREGANVAGLGDRRGAGDQAGRSRAHLREVLPRRPQRRAQGRHRPRPVDQPRPRRGDGRPHLGREPGGQAARHAHRHRDAGGRGAELAKAAS